MVESVTSLSFHKATFWVQIHGLPTLSQTKEAGLRIGGILGKVEKVDVGDKGFSLGFYLGGSDSRFGMNDFPYFNLLLMWKNLS